MDIFIHIPKLIFLQAKVRASPVFMALNQLLSGSASSPLYPHFPNNQWGKQALNVSSRGVYMYVTFELCLLCGRNIIL